MATWGVEARIKYRAWNTSTNAGVAGDSANHTLTLRREGTDSAFVGTINDLGGGVYEAVVSGTLAETYELAMRGTSATADVVLFFESPVRTVKAAPTLTEIANQITTDHGAGSYVDSGAGLDAVGVRTAVGLASANLDAQLGAIPTTAPLDATATEAAALAAVTSYAPAKAGDAMALTSGERSAVRSDLLTETVYGQSLPANFGSLAIGGDGVVEACIEQVAGVEVASVDDFKATEVIASNMVAAAPTAAEIWAYSTRSLTVSSSGATAQEVWEYGTRTLTAIDLSGLEVSALTPEQATWLEAIHGKTALIGTTDGAFISSPVTRTGRINPIVAGDDYLAENNRALSWAIPVSKNGSASSVIFKAVATEDSSVVIGPVSGSVSGTGDSQIATVELSGDETNVPPGTYRWDLQIKSTSGKTATPWYGDLKVIGDVAD